LEEFEPEQITSFLKSGTVGLGGETFEVLEILLSKMPVYLPDNPTYHDSSRFKNILDVIISSLAYNIYINSIVHFEENDKELKRSFPSLLRFLKRDVETKKPSEFYKSIVKYFKPRKHANSAC
jgi:hypothetical protein